MRKFTKEHNDLKWLFPTTRDVNEASSLFDEVEGMGETLLELCYGEQETFTRDDIMDAFMKGYSEACQMEGFKMYQLRQMCERLEKQIQDTTRMFRLLKRENKINTKQ